MKSKLPIKIHPDFEIVVTKGNKVKAGDKLAKRSKKSREEKIPVSSILSIKTELIPKYLTRRVGSKVGKGEVIAKKDSFVKTVKIVAPFDGVLSSIDLKKGILIIEGQAVEDEFEFAPIEGAIDEIMDSEIVLTVDGDVVKGTKGQGITSFGDVMIFSKELDMFDFTSEVNGKIIMAPSFTEGAISKLHALEGKGIITTEFYQDFPTVVVVEEDLFTKLASIKPKRLILLGAEGSIIIPS